MKCGHTQETIFEHYKAVTKTQETEKFCRFLGKTSVSRLQTAIFSTEYTCIGK